MDIICCASQLHGFWSTYPAVAQHEAPFPEVHRSGLISIGWELNLTSTCKMLPVKVLKPTYIQLD